ncbi:MAG: PfkB family carbohydrate kinase [Selenomonas sp.]|nr:PfkB family carbohydrate kinase [Selenomonadales bacterium]MDY5717732.1 PfkB family carbohydrate kinase [Selenomonas sp.]
MVEVLTFGEPMGLMAADEVKPLKDVEHFTRYVCGAEVNFSVGLSRLGHSVAYISIVGADPFGEHICDFLAENKISH